MEKEENIDKTKKNEYKVMEKIILNKLNKI